ncbi:MAG: hypothetical protein JWN63_2571 [Candidatus Acidoferrum typicum]|nr:hypothetical protein [Candidatus Acidoferrum typicum]
MQTIAIRIPDYLFRSIEQACDTRGCLSAEKYMLELAEADTAEFRVKKIKTQPLGPQGEPALEQTPEQKTYQHRAVVLRPADLQRLLHLSGQMGVPALAKRFRISVSSIRRILQQHKQHAVHVPERGATNA